MHIMYSLIGIILTMLYIIRVYLNNMHSVGFKIKQKKGYKPGSFV